MWNIVDIVVVPFLLIIGVVAVVVVCRASMRNRTQKPIEMGNPDGNCVEESGLRWPRILCSGGLPVAVGTGT